MKCRVLKAENRFLEQHLLVATEMKIAIRGWKVKVDTTRTV